MNHRSALAILAGTISLLSTQAASANWVDRFDTAAYILPQTWRGEEESTAGGRQTEVDRSIVNGQLRMRSKAWAWPDTDSNVGAIQARNSLVQRKVEGATGIFTKVTMRTATAVPCSTNETPTVTRARLFGYFFNAGTSAPESHLDDVFASVQLYRSSNSTDPVGTLRVSGTVGRCTNAACTTYEALGSRTMGTVQVGEPVEIGVFWQQEAAQFGFSRQMPDTTQYYYVPYTVSDSQASIAPDKRVEISNQIANCAPRHSTADGIADFDYVNIAQ
jgi:hypothetical protein